jgi:hypothetical protein
LPQGVSVPNADSIEEAPAKRRLLATVTERMWVDVDPEEAERLLDPSDYLDVYEAVDRYRRIAAHATEHIDADVTLEADDDTTRGDYWRVTTPVDGNGRQRYLWSARHFVGKARHELSLGRYREGYCPELDKVNGALARLEDELRLMAMEGERPEWPEVKAWRASQHVTESDCYGL